jgi:DinB superfamily
MRYVRQAGSDPAFLLKALGEASGELRQALYGLRRSVLLIPGEGQDDGWTLLALACHMRDVELGVYEQIEAILRGRGEAPIPHVGIDDIPFREDYEDEDEDEVLEEFHYYRRQTAYTLWDISERDWDRAGTSPYRGRMTLLEITRDLYQHDLEHLWQARRMADALGVAKR